MSVFFEIVVGVFGNVIEICELCKVYWDWVVVDGLILMVGVGEVFGFFGFNGVGKSIIVKMLLGLVILLGGEVWVLCGLFVDLVVCVWLGFLFE